MTPTIDITTTAGKVDYELAMDGRAVAEDAMVRVNGLPTSYPESFADSSGELPTTLDDGATREIGSLSGRTSRVFVESEPVDGIDTQVETQISFNNDSAS